MLLRTHWYWCFVLLLLHLSKKIQRNDLEERKTAISKSIFSAHETLILFWRHPERLDGLNIQDAMAYESGNYNLNFVALLQMKILSYSK